VPVWLFTRQAESDQALSFSLFPQEKADAGDGPGLLACITTSLGLALVWTFSALH
jgi:hypothetical protein